MSPQPSQQITQDIAVTARPAGPGKNSSHEAGRVPGSSALTKGRIPLQKTKWSSEFQVLLSGKVLQNQVSSSSKSIMQCTTVIYANYPPVR